MKKLYFILIVMVSCAALGAVLEQSLIGADSLRVGSRFAFSLKAEQSLKQAIVPDTLTVFKVLSNKVVSSSGKPDHIELSIMPMRLGALSFPELRIIGEDGSEYKSDRFRVHVLSVRAEGDTLLRDVKPTQRYPYEPDFRLFLALVALAVILLILLLLRLFRSERIEPEMKPQVFVPNWKRALELLSALLKEGLLEAGEYAAFHYRLSEILRSYLEAEYRFNAGEMTTFEIRLHLKHGKQMIPQQDELIRFLRECDLVKYARQIPRQNEVEARISWLQNYLVSNFQPSTAEPGRQNGDSDAKVL